jgi:sensor histidine kinase regulating citrate/malate metabolism
LFDSVAENLLQNAIAKAQTQSAKINVTFELASGAGLTVSDTGEAIPKSMATRLFAAPVPSQNGLGIGLYQASKHAEQVGYSLRLANNTPGNVCFELRKTAD